jgi:hypothetical protein
MTVGELVYQTAIKDGYNPKFSEGFLSSLNKATEHIYKNTQEDIRYEIHIHDGRFWIDLEEESEVAEIVEKYGEGFDRAMKK